MAGPVVKSVLLCDQIISDKLTNKQTLVGLFDELTAPVFPWVHSSLGIHFRIADLETGEHKIRVVIRLNDVESTQELAGFAIKANQKKRGNFAAGVNIIGVPLPQAGEYLVEIQVDNGTPESFPWTVRAKEKKDA